MSSVFPDPIRKLPEADVPIDGVQAYLSQSEGHQLVFMEFSKDVVVPEHSHESQWAVVVEGRIDVVIGGEAQTDAAVSRRRVSSPLTSAMIRAT